MRVPTRVSESFTQSSPCFFSTLAPSPSTGLSASDFERIVAVVLTSNTAAADGLDIESGCVVRGQGTTDSEQHATGNDNTLQDVVQLVLYAGTVVESTPHFVEAAQLGLEEVLAELE